MALMLKALGELGKKRYKQSLSIVPYIFTFLNAFFGFLSVAFALNDDIVMAASCIGLAALMDSCDGRIARKFGLVSSLGAELDSLCDAISFCFAPIILLFCFYDYPMNVFHLAILSLYLCAGLFRLARFNCSQSSSGQFFSGLPTPAAAFVLASLLFYHERISQSSLKFMLNPTSALILVLMLALLMVSSIPFSSFKQQKISLLMSMMMVIGLFGIAIAQWYGLPVFFFLFLTYVMNGILHWLYYCAKRFLKKKF